MNGFVYTIRNDLMIHSYLFSHVGFPVKKRIPHFYVLSLKKIRRKKMLL